MPFFSEKNMRSLVSCLVVCVLINVLNSPISSADELLKPSAAGDIAWQSNAESAVLAARDSGKPLVVFVTADFCVYCRRMEETVWTNKEIIRAVDEKFVALKLDPARHEQLIEKLGVQAFPTTIVFDQKGQPLATAKGFVNPSTMLKMLAKNDRIQQTGR